MREVQGLLTIESRVCLEAGLMQEPDTIHRPSQVATPSPGILSVGCGFLASQLGRMVDQQACTGVSEVITGHGSQSIGDGALFLTDILFEATKLTEAVHNDQAGLYQLH